MDLTFHTGLRTERVFAERTVGGQPSWSALDGKGFQNMGLSALKPGPPGKLSGWPGTKGFPGTQNVECPHQESARNFRWSS